MEQPSTLAELPATRLYDEVTVGDELPELVIEVTPTLIVAGAIASDDFEDVHHDRDAAQRRGTKDIFMNILTTNGLVGRFVTDWSGPGGLLCSVSIRLGAPNYPGDTMTLSGSVGALAGVEPGGERGLVEVTVRGANSLGDHVTGTVAVSLPVSLPGSLPGGGDR